MRPNSQRHRLFRSLPPPPDRPRESLEAFVSRGGRVERVQAAPPPERDPVVPARGGWSGDTGGGVVPRRRAGL